MTRLKLGIFLTLAALVVTAGIAAAAGLRQGSRDAAAARVAFTQGSSLWMANADGSGRLMIARGNPSSPISWYEWSPDGRYLLVVRSHPNTSSSDLLLYDAYGTRLRALVRHAPWSGFYASWAANADRVAFVAGTCGRVGVRASGCPASNEAVFSVGVQGNRTFIGSYQSAGGGCGGGLQDPAANLYRIETDFGITMPVLHWRTGHALSFLGVMGYVPPLPERGTGAAFPSDIAVSSGGAVAGTIQRCTSTGCSSYVALLDPATGRALRIIGRGELPAWSPDGKTLYFVRRTAQRTLMFHDSNNNTVPSQVYRSEIWRTNASGQQLTKVLTEPAYGFGPLAVTTDGQSVIFSRVDNASRLWQHRLAGNRFDDRLVKAYGPTVSVDGVNVTNGAVTEVVSNAGRPAMQPAAAQ